MEERGAFNWALFLRSASSHGSEIHLHRRLHMLHAALYRSRSIIAFIFFTISVVMIPFALQLLQSRDGANIVFFGDAAEPPPEDMIWQGDTSTSDLGTTVYEEEPDWPVLYNEVVSELMYTPVEISHALWPSGGVYLAVLLCIDIAITGALFYRRALAIIKTRALSTQNVVRLSTQEVQRNFTV
eukprot:4958228-Prymnesium_polylepis.2